MSVLRCDFRVLLVLLFFGTVRCGGYHAGLFPVETISGNISLGVERDGRILESDMDFQQFGAMSSPVETTDLQKRQNRYCPGTTIYCPNGVTCHPLGTHCCNEQGQYCPDSETCCVAEQTCAPSGYFCCPGTKSGCPDGYTCCPQSDGKVLCAPPGGECCANTACKAGYECDSCDGNGAVKARDLSNSSPHNQRDILESAPKLDITDLGMPLGDLVKRAADDRCTISGGTCCGDFTCDSTEQCCKNAEGAPSHCADKDATCCGDGYCTDGKQCCGNGLGCADANKKCCEGMKAACAVGEKCCMDPDDGTPYCGENNECYPTLTFPHVAGITDEMHENICEGLRRHYAKNRHIIFEYNGRAVAEQRTTAQQRRDAGCGGRLVCAARPMPLTTDIVAWNCDEFPMASTTAGGAGSAIRCVPARLNTFYGTIWNWFLATHGYRAGLKVRIKIQECDYTLPPTNRGPITKREDSFLEKRQDGSSVLVAHGNLTVLSSSMFGNLSNSSNVVLIPLTSDSSGSGLYTLNYNLTTGSMLSGTIMDEDGQTYDAMDKFATGASDSRSFTLSSDANGNVMFVGLTKDKDVQMKYDVKAPEPSSTSAAPSASSTAVSATPPKSGAVKYDRGDWGAWIGFILSLGWMTRGVLT